MFFFLSQNHNFWEKSLIGSVWIRWPCLDQPTLVRSEGKGTLKHGFSHMNHVVGKGRETIFKRKVEGIVSQKIKQQVPTILLNLTSHYSPLESSPCIVSWCFFLLSASILSPLDYLPTLLLRLWGSSCKFPLHSFSAIKYFCTSISIKCHIIMPWYCN